MRRLPPSQSDFARNSVLFQVQFSRDGNYLYTGTRRDGDIFCWDVRMHIRCCVPPAAGEHKHQPAHAV